MQVPLERVGWAAVAAGLDEVGWSRILGLLSARECDELVDVYKCDERFRATISMERHRYALGLIFHDAE